MGLMVQQTTPGCLFAACLSTFPHSQECAYLDGCGALWMLRETDRRDLQGERTMFPDTGAGTNRFVEAMALGGLMNRSESDPLRVRITDRGRERARHG